MGTGSTQDCLRWGGRAARENIFMLPSRCSSSIRSYQGAFTRWHFLAKYALPHLQSGDTIINTVSVTPYAGTGPALDYISMKGVIVAFTRRLSNQQVSRGIRVNAVASGPAWTPLAVSTMDKSRLANLLRHQWDDPVSLVRLLLVMYSSGAAIAALWVAKFCILTAGLLSMDERIHVP